MITHQRFAAGMLRSPRGSGLVTATASMPGSSGECWGPPGLRVEAEPWLWDLGGVQKGALGFGGAHVAPRVGGRRGGAWQGVAGAAPDLSCSLPRSSSGHSLFPGQRMQKADAKGSGMISMSDSIFPSASSAPEPHGNGPEVLILCSFIWGVPRALP